MRASECSRYEPRVRPRRGARSPTGGVRAISYQFKASCGEGGPKWPARCIISSECVCSMTGVRSSNEGHDMSTKGHERRTFGREEQYAVENTRTILEDQRLLHHPNVH